MQAPSSDTRVATGAVGEDAAFEGVAVMLEMVRVKGRRQGRGQAGLVDVAEFGPDRAAPEAELRRRLGTYTEASPAVQAGPFRLEEVPLEAPERFSVADLLHLPVHGNDPRQGRTALRRCLPRAGGP